MNEPYLQSNFRDSAESFTDYLRMMAAPDYLAPPVPQWGPVTIVDPPTTNRKSTNDSNDILNNLDTTTPKNPRPIAPNVSSTDDASYMNVPQRLKQVNNCDTVYNTGHAIPSTAPETEV